jgi:hypothetical protein
MSITVQCSDPDYDPVGCNDPLCAYGDCNTAITDPIDNFNNAGSVGLASQASEHGGTAIANGGNVFTSIFSSIAGTVVATSAALNAPKPTSGFTVPGIGAVGTFGSSGIFILAIVGLGVWYLAKKA